jgi:hypothetical protein
LTGLARELVVSALLGSDAAAVSMSKPCRNPVRPASGPTMGLFVVFGVMVNEVATSVSLAKHMYGGLLRGPAGQRINNRFYLLPCLDSPPNMAFQKGIPFLVSWCDREIDVQPSTPQH